MIKFLKKSKIYSWNFGNYSILLYEFSCIFVVEILQFWGRVMKVYRRAEGESVIHDESPKLQRGKKNTKTDAVWYFSLSLKSKNPKITFSVTSHWKDFSGENLLFTLPWVLEEIWKWNLAWIYEILSRFQKKKKFLIGQEFLKL